MCEIENIVARQILDSRGNPTVEVDVHLIDGTVGRASVPSGISTGLYEAKELRDNIKNEYYGKGVTKSIENINNIITPNLLGEDVLNQTLIDNILIELDGTCNKNKLGSNTILAVSLACARAGAESIDVPLYRYLGGINAKVLPTPMMNILNGGHHANNKLDIQEFMIAPVGMTSYREALRAGSEIFHTLKFILEEKGLATTVGDEGGFAPEINSAEEGIEFVITAIEKSGYSTKDVKICLDVAASELYHEGECSDGVCSLSYYVLKGEHKKYNTDEMIEYLETLVNNYPIISIEDGLAEDDWLGWNNLTLRLGDKCQIVGDDLFVTNSARLQTGIDKHIANAVLIKPNQIGTLTETINTVLLANRNGYNTIVSHRSGETEDSFIADLTVALNCGLIKTGSLSRSDRTAKYNQLLRIEEELAEGAQYLGLKSFKI